MKSLLTDISWRLASVRVRYTVGELLSWCLVCLVQQLLPSSAGVIITPSSWVHCHSPGETLCLSGRQFWFCRPVHYPWRLLCCVLLLLLLFCNEVTITS